MIPKALGPLHTIRNVDIISTVTSPQQKERNAQTKEIKSEQKTERQEK
mgnify:CR=1 FL=1